MATNNAVNVGLSGSTGSGSFVGSNSPTLTTPNLGTPSALVKTNATGDSVGTTTNDNAAAGHVGEFISNQANTGTVSLTSTIVADITSISLTAGDWDVFGNVAFTNSGSTITAAVGGISSTSATFDAQLGEGSTVQMPYTTVSGTPVIGGMRRRYSLSGTTTIYLLGVAAFTGGTIAAGGFIGARRVR